MYSKSKKLPFAILFIPALICSRTMFMFIDDPEGPNLLIVVVMALIIYFLSLTTYLFYPRPEQNNLAKIPLVILVQILVVTLFYLLLTVI